MTRSKTRFSALLVTAIAPCLAIAGCGGGGAGEPSGSERTDITLSATEPDSLDLTTNTSGHIGTILLYNVLETLVKIDSEGEPQPLLAESWDVSDDGRVYTFDLVEAEFSDGTEFNAEDVVFSFERAMADDSAHPQKGQFEAVEKVEAVDDRTARVTLSRPSNNWIYFMGHRAGAILSEESIDQMATKPVGTGPFTVGEWARGDHLTLQQNQDYWGEAPSLTEVNFQFIDDPNAVVNALLTGEVDMAPNLFARERVEEIEASEQLEVVERPTHEVVPLIVNNSVKPLSDVRVRRALTHAIDREAILEGTYAGFGDVIGSHVGPIDPWYTDLTSEYPYDPERARELLAEAGHPNGVKLTLRVPDDPNHVKTAEIIAGMAPEAGFDIELQIEDLAVWLEEVLDPSRAEFELTLAGFVRPRSIHDYENDFAWKYTNDNLTRTLREADAAVDPGEQVERYEEAQRILAEDAVNVWLVQPTEVTVVPDNLEGYVDARVDLAADMTQVHFAGSE